MAKYLVIVESPAKVKTIKKFLGSNYEVAASDGHIRDLPKSSLGIDIEHNYEPKYITIRGKGDILANLRREVKKAEKIYLATDPDREGEAISWHLLYALKLENPEGDKKVYRITFNEITKNVVKESLKSAREINMNLVDAQQARRVLDRMVGYRISPLLWKKIKRGLSAGRVQSAVLRLICDREDEINAFIPEEYWTLDVKLKVEGEKKPVTAKYYGTVEEKKSITCREQAEEIMESLKGAGYSVAEIRRGERLKKPPLPFITATLQQEASRTLNFSTQKTMRLAQQLYEGVDIKGEGTVGLITYLRTDSTRVSAEAEKMAAEYITGQYGDAYLAQALGEKKNDQRVQDAHEAIRPTDLSRLPAALKEELPRDLFRLYQLIWKRFLASRMSPAKYETTSVKIRAGEHMFTAAASAMKFDGFTLVYGVEEDGKEGEDEKSGGKGALTMALSEDSKFTFDSFDPVQHFTQPPAHYTEATLVGAMRELGIGRPSTYAATITTILSRRYVAKEEKNLYVTELGEAVNHMMKEAFPAVVDVNFTANMEALLDGVEEGSVRWKTIVSNFYPDLEDAVEQAEKNLEQVTIADEVSDEVCDLCGRQMVIKYGPHGRFLACPGFPECRNTKPYYEKIGVSCPKCGRDIVLKKTKKGRKYYGCIGNPECDFMVWQKPSGERCPKCGSVLLEKGSRLVCADEKCGYHITPTKKEE